MQPLIMPLCILKVKVCNAAANASVLLLDHLLKSQLGEEVKGTCMLGWGSFRTGWVQVWGSSHVAFVLVNPGCRLCTKLDWYT